MYSFAYLPGLIGDDLGCFVTTGGSITIVLRVVCISVNAITNRNGSLKNHESWSSLQSDKESIIVEMGSWQAE